MVQYLFMALIMVAMAAYLIGRAKAFSIAAGNVSALHSRPVYHGTYLAILSAFPAFLAMVIWPAITNRYLDNAVLSRFGDHLSQLTLPETEAFLRDAKAIAYGGVIGFRDETKEAAAEVYLSLQSTADLILLCIVALLVLVGFLFAIGRIKVDMRARFFVEKFVLALLLASSVVAILATIGIVLSLLVETVRFFGKVSFFDFLFGIHWSPQSAFEAAGGNDITQDNSRVFGAIPLFTGTLLITLIAILVAAPVGLMSAIYLSDYASSSFRSFAKPMLEILAGIPTVVYGFFAALTVAPAIRGWGENLGLDVSSESALAAGLVMGIMIIPFVSSLSDDVINAVPQSLRDGSAALGATKSETIRKVVLPAALPGIVSALLLAISRAIGETMIVVMAAGLAANLTANPFEAVTTVTVQIVTLLVGDQEFDSAKTLAAFALGLVLFCITLGLNYIALKVVQKYREQYD
ncbi:MAG: phosphate ABC transporter permease subunit PstC [Pseudomonadota bacterium]